MSDGQARVLPIAHPTSRIHQSTGPGPVPDPSPNCLGPDPQSLDEGPVPIVVLPLQIPEKSAPLADQKQETPPRVMITLVDLQVLRDTRDPLREEGDLYLGGARIPVRTPVVTDDFGLSGCAQQDVYF